MRKAEADNYNLTALKYYAAAFLWAILLPAIPAQQADLEFPITVYDNSGQPNNPGNLIFGIDSAATDSIDSWLGEHWLYCPWDNPYSDCLPWDHFEVISDLPVTSPGLEWGTHKDIRHGFIPFTGEIEHKLYWGSHSTATAIYITWNFPPGVIAWIRDIITGNLVNYLMADSGTYSSPYFLQYQVLPWRLIINYNNAVPVEIASFGASAQGNTVVLEWSTASELNNSGFEIERCLYSAREGRGETEEWKKIAFIEGNGTTSEKQNYVYTDNPPFTGTIKYRLKQIDFDGTFSWSNEITVTLEPQVFSLSQNYPNPFNPATTISYSLPEKGKVRLIVYDALGREVRKLVDEDKTAGRYEIEFNAEGLSSGMYFYRLSAGERVISKKMVLLK